MNDLFVNTVIEWCDSDNKPLFLERILWISPELEYVYVIKIIDKKIEMPYKKTYSEILNALETPFVRKLKNDPFINTLRVDQQYLNRHAESRDKAWEIFREVIDIEPEIYDPNFSGEIVKDLILKHNISKPWIYKMLKRYWNNGKSRNAFLPLFHNSGGAGKAKTVKHKKIGRPSKKSKENPSLQGVNVQERDKKIFSLAVKAYYEKSKKPDLKFTYDTMIRDFYYEGYHLINGVKAPILPQEEEVPTYRQFRYWFHKDNEVSDKAKMRYGEREYNLNKRPLVGNVTNRAKGPGAIFEIDATVADVYLVSSLARDRIIGRPVVYIVKDVFSRMVVGVYVGVEGPSWLGAMMALENATVNKKEYCEGIGLNIEEEEWPARNLSSSITADRGEIEGGNIDKFINMFGVKIDNTPPYRADLKGIVEQHFRTINTKIKRWIPGAVHKDYKQRGGKDYRLDAKLTLKAFERIIILSILEHNKKLITNYPLSTDMILDDVIATPITLWNWGRKRRYGNLLEVNRELIRLSLLPSDNASIRRDGIYFKKRLYSCSYAVKEGWFEDAAEKGVRRITVSYDPRNINQIFIQNEKGDFVRCEMIEPFFLEKNISPRLEDLLEFEEKQFIDIDLQKGKQKQMSSDIDAQIGNIIAQEINKTEQSQIPGRSNLSKTKEIKENRKLERESIRAEESWGNTLDETKDLKGQIIKMKEVPSNEEALVGVNDLISMLENLDDKEN